MALTASTLRRLQNPHENLDDAEHDARYSEAADSRAMDSSRIGGDEGMNMMDRQICITRADLKKYGYTPHCHRCLDIAAGAYGSKAHHSEECRLRIYLKYYENSEKKWRDIEGQLSRQGKPAGDKEEIRLEGLERSGAKAMEEPRHLILLCQRVITFNSTNALLKVCKLQIIHLADRARLSHTAAKMLTRLSTSLWISPRMTMIWVTPQLLHLQWRQRSSQPVLARMPLSCLSIRS